jgi:ribosomal protein S13
MLTAEDIQIAEARVNGLSLRQIETQTGIDKDKAWRRLDKAEVKSLVETMQQRIAAEAYQSATDNIIHAIKSYQIEGIKNDPQLREHGYKASVRIAESIGILPSHTPSLILQQINQVEIHNYLDPAAQNALSHLGIEAGAVDAEEISK